MKASKTNKRDNNQYRQGRGETGAGCPAGGSGGSVAAVEGTAAGLPEIKNAVTT